MFRSSSHPRAAAAAADGSPVVAPAPARSRWLQGYHSRNEQQHVDNLQTALNNPNTTSAERDQAKTELNAMGHGQKAHVPMSVKVKSMFRSKKAKRNAATTDTARV